MMIENDTDLFHTATKWLKNDPDDETRAELSALLSAAGYDLDTPAGTSQAIDTHIPHDSAAAAALADLRSRFNGRLSFGTAGLRAQLGAGPRRMNCVVIKQSTAGFAEFLLKTRREAGDPLKVVVGYDARKNSRKFALLTARVLSGYGITALLLPGPLPTPVTAFAVRQLQASAGVMITASHNPPQDNGYKVYLGGTDNGSQIIPPDDKNIAAEIDRVAQLPLPEIPENAAHIEPVSDFILTEYVAATVRNSAPKPASNPRIVYTAMHGVGAGVTRRVFETAGFKPLYEVSAQNQPDPLFPTVKFPNPEEPGALDLAYETAKQVSADLIIAHDPDADRLAVALPARDGGGYTMLTGNQLGLLLGWHVAQAHAQQEGAGRTADSQAGALACTIVSSPALGAVAAHYGLEYFETLSGFKWISRVPNLIFGYEEALGYLVNPSHIRDKDGISAALAIAQLAADLHAQGKTLWHKLDEAAELFGYYASGQVTLRLADQKAAGALMEQLRQQEIRELGGVSVASVTDLDKSAAGNMRANVIRYDLADGSRIMVRPSGTEPKLKLYVDTRSVSGSAAARKIAAEAALQQQLSAAKELLKSLE